MTRASFAQTPYGRTPSGYLGPLPSRPSQPNYLYLFAGNNQGVLPEYFAQPSMPAWYPYKGTASNDTNGDLFPFTHRDIQVGIGNRRVPEQMLPFSTPNLGASIMAKGGSFAGFFESLPYPTFQNETFDDGEGLYKRKHDPVINWVDLHDTSRLVTTQNALPLAAHLGFKSTTDPQMHRRFRGFVEDADGKPMGFDQLPTVSLVVPNQAHDGHDASLAKADEWLKKNIGPYAQWALAHDGLLVITFDEDGATRNVPGGAKRAGIDNIPTLFYGPMVRPGRYDEPVDHLNVLATILLLHGDLERFRTQFAAAYRSVEAEHELANLRPILDIFSGGIALQAFSQPR